MNFSKIILCFLVILPLSCIKNPEAEFQNQKIEDLQEKYDYLNSKMNELNTKNSDLKDEIKDLRLKYSKNTGGLNRIKKTLPDSIIVKINIQK